MNVILREHEYAENILRSKLLGNNPTKELILVARYYLDKGYSKNETKNLLKTLIIQCRPMVSIVRWADVIDFAIIKAIERKAINIDGVEIYESEMKKIEELESKQLRRLAFTLLCLDKYQQIASPQKDHWVNYSDSAIMGWANINTSVKRRSEMFRVLQEKELIRFSHKVGNIAVRVCFSDETGVVSNIVTDFRNLGFQYMKLYDDEYIECQSCGLTIKLDNPKKGKKQKYCKDCASEIALQQIANSLKKHRETSKTT